MSKFSRWNIAAQYAVNELGISGSLYKHTSGAQLCHMRPQGNGVQEPTTVALGFKTAVSNSSGLPHILEHTVLCGSKHYPVKDPFFKMLTRTQSTYMNAWTFSDMTVYPFSSLLPKDVENLRSVYSDAVFHPLLRASDFEQEGWRMDSNG